MRWWRRLKASNEQAEDLSRELSAQSICAKKDAETRRLEIERVVKEMTRKQEQ